MQSTDIPRVVRIDEQSFAVPWSARSYTFEVNQSNYSHMVVLEHLQPRPPDGRWQAWWQSVTGRVRIKQTLLAYGGLWYFGAQAHISTIATAPEHRQQGYGEVVFLAMLCRAISLSSQMATLEVRVSNIHAQHLYEKYGFQQRGVKAGYYIDNDEDAYDMALSLTDRATIQHIESCFEGYTRQLGLQDRYTRSAPS